MFQMTRPNLRIVKSFPSADFVFAIGEFNNWSTVATPLTKNGDENWELQLPPNVDLDHLGFFVISEGARCGHVIGPAHRERNEWATSRRIS
jgi:1,4-alpha-glucan branching enzyme